MLQLQLKPGQRRQAWQQARWRLGGGKALDWNHSCCNFGPSWPADCQSLCLDSKTAVVL